MLCEYNITVYDDYDVIANISTLYPFWEGSLEVSAQIPTCKPYATVEDEGDLLFWYRVNMAPVDFCTGCDVGKIPKEWCRGRCEVG